MSLPLNCLIRGDDPEKVFTVNVPMTDDVSTLKQLIKEANSYSFPAKNIILWKVCLPLHDIAAISNVKLESNIKLSPPEKKLSEVFDQVVARDDLHVIAIMPETPSRIPTQSRIPTRSLSLNCLIHGDDLEKIFTVEIQKVKNVSILKKLIKEEKAPHLDHLAASDLDLWNVCMPLDNIAAISSVKPESNAKLSPPTKRLSEIFDQAMDEVLHIIAKVPPALHRHSALPSGSKSALHEKPAIENAWKMTFRGTGATLFKDALDDMNEGRGEKFYANFVPIVQSSGMGKSRLVDETAKLIFTIPFCFRTELDGYPEADIAPRDFFRLRDNDTYDVVFDRCLLFLEKLFTIVRHEILENLPKRTETPLPVLWYNYLLNDGKQTRRRIYNETVTTTSASLNAKRMVHYSTPQSASSQVRPEQRAVYIAAQALIDTIKSHAVKGGPGGKHHPRPVQLLVYIDESHEMTTRAQTIQGDGRNAYQILCSSLNKLRQLDLFFVFLSTNSLLSDYSPSSRVFWSARALDSTIPYVQTPYTELPFDVWKESHLVSEGVHTMENVCSLEFMIRFGRLLWWTRWEAGDFVIRETLLEFAMMKLAASNGRKNYDSQSFLAALSVRLMLDFEPRRISAVENEKLMVAGHLRVANVIPSHREYIISSTPSEPIVAEAAAQILRGENMVGLLHRNVINGLIEKGQRGELAARLLLTLAHDAALFKMDIKRVAGQGQMERLFTTPIPLLDFISALFAKPHIESIMKALPDDQPSGPTFRESFRDAYVMFTHFGKAADDWCISDIFAFMALSRNMAIACRETMKYADLCIPIHFGKEIPLSRNSTSAIFVSIKDKVKSMGYNQTYIDVDKMNFFTNGDKRRPVIKLILQLGIRSAGRHIAIKHTKTQQTPGLLPTPERKGRGGQEVPRTPIGVSVQLPGNTDTNPRKTRAQATTSSPSYTIDARGCSSDIYDVIHAVDEPLWHELLASKDFLSEHSRQNTRYLDAMMAQKPIWTGGPECRSWVGLSDPHSQDLEQDAGVSEGIFLGVDPGDVDPFV